MAESFWIETLGCPKNQVDSDKIAGSLLADGMRRADGAEDADLVVVNTCAFVESAREESVDAVLSLSEHVRLGEAGEQREEKLGERQTAAQGETPLVPRGGKRLVVTGCMAERYGSELAEALPEVDAVAGFGVPVNVGGVGSDARFGGTKVSNGAGVPDRTAISDRATAATAVPAMDLLNMARPKSELPWAYVKIAEGCDRSCGYCAIPQFRGPQRSRSVEAICEEVEALEIREAVLIAQDLAAYGRDAARDSKNRETRESVRFGDSDNDEPASSLKLASSPKATSAALPAVKLSSLSKLSPPNQSHLLNSSRPIIPLIQEVAKRVDWVRLLYLYPADLTDELTDAIFATGVPYFDLSLQHVSRPLLRRMRRWGDGDRFLSRIQHIRRQEPDAAFRSNFIVGYPGETEEDHEQLLEFIEAAQLDWCAFFAFSSEEGTYAADLSDHVPASLIAERLAELRETQDAITESRRRQLLGRRMRVLVDAPGTARSHREAPEIDGIIHVPDHLPAGEFAEVEIKSSVGPDLEAGLVKLDAPVKLAKPVAQIKPSEPVKLAASAKLAEPVKSVAQIKPSEPVKQTKPVPQTKPATLASTSKPVAAGRQSHG